MTEHEQDEIKHAILLLETSSGIDKSEAISILRCLVPREDMTSPKGEYLVTLTDDFLVGAQTNAEGWTRALNSNSSA